MLSIFQPASLLISIDVSSHLETTGLLELLGGYDVAATWNLADLQQTGLVSRIVAANARHEIGILGDDRWVGSRIVRSRFAVELQRRVDLASAANCRVSVLSSENPPAASHFDLLVKHGISAITTNSLGSKVRERPRQLRYGLWRIDANRCLGRRSSGWLAGTERQIRRAIDSAVKHRESCHLSVDASAMASRQSRVLQRTLHHADQLRRTGSLQIVTLGQMARGLSRPQIPVRSARSILRRAA